MTATGSGHDRRVLAASLPENVASLNGHVPQQQPPADTLEAMTADTTVTSVEDVRVTVEADRLAALVRELTAENRELAAAAAVWQERARVLSDQLALAAPQSPPDASGATESPDRLGRSQYRSLTRFRRHCRRHRTSAAGGSGWLTCLATDGRWRRRVRRIICLAWVREGKR